MAQITVLQWVVTTCNGIVVETDFEDEEEARDYCVNWAHLYTSESQPLTPVLLKGTVEVTP